MNRTIEAGIAGIQGFADIARHNPSRIHNVVGLLGLAPFGLKQCFLMIESYQAARILDDKGDGDYIGVEHPRDYVSSIRDRIGVRTLGSSHEERMLSYSIEELETKAKPGDHPRDDFIKILSSIIFDYDRAKDRRVFSAQQIEEYYRDAFDPVMNITLLALDSKLRSWHVPALSFGQGRVYSARDLATDWKRGIINIPAEIVEEASLTNVSSVEDVLKNLTIQSWVQDSLSKTKQDIIKTQTVIRNSKEIRTQLVCGTLISSMLKYIDTH